MLNLIGMDGRACARSLMMTAAGMSLLVACGTNDVLFGPPGAGSTSSGQGGSGASSDMPSSSATGGQGGDGGQGTSSGNSGGSGGGAADCGDGMISGQEDCDGDDLGGMTCTDMGFDAPDGLACSDGCEFDLGGCEAACDGVSVEPGEACDGDDFAGKDCTDYGYSNPAGLDCTGQCEIDSNACQATCDGQLVEPGEDCDGGDLGGKTCKDFGFVEAAGLSCGGDCLADTSACTALCGNNMTEPGEDCDDGNQDPGDGCDQCKFDGKTCGTATGVLLHSGKVVLPGVTTGGAGSQTSSEQFCEKGTKQQTAANGDRVFAVTPVKDGFVTASLTYGVTNFDAVLYVRSDCNNAQTEFACADNYYSGQNALLPGAEVLSFYGKKGTTYYVIVDGWSGNGDFELVLDLSEGTCADPVPFPLWKGRPMRATGVTEHGSNEAQSSCGGGMAKDVVYEVTPYASATLEAELPGNSSNFSTLVYAQTSCGDQNTQLSCDGNGTIDIDVMTTAGTPVFVWVDGQSQQQGEYELVLDPNKGN